MATEEVSRAKYARLCIEVDLSQPLVAKFRMRRRIWRIEYKGIHLVYYGCGKYGHKEDECPRESEKDEDHKETVRKHKIAHTTATTCPEVIEEFGPWMPVQRQRRKPQPPTRRDIIACLNQGDMNGNSTNLADLQVSRYLAITNYEEEDPVGSSANIGILNLRNHIGQHEGIKEKKGNQSRGARFKNISTNFLGNQ